MGSQIKMVSADVVFRNGSAESEVCKSHRSNYQ